MPAEKIINYVFGEAAKSNVNKRKVGCVIVDRNEAIVAAGRNASFEEDDKPDIHAEDMACQEFVAKDVEDVLGPFIAYVTHQPCPDCAMKLLDHGISKVEVVEAFLKFDGDKIRPDLIPASAFKALAEVLTFGARKYKPNNWKNCKDLDRYKAAMLRHIIAYQGGEIFDAESGMPHLWHAMTNIAFLIELDSKSKHALTELN